MKHVALFALLALGGAASHAQVGRHSLTAGHERYLEADFRGALPLLAAGLDPDAGPLDESWRLGVQRVVDVLLVLGQDSVATTWLRWANRLAPDFVVDAELMPPAVVRASRAARAFVDSTPYDRFVSRTTFEWPRARTPGANASIRLASVDIPITARVGSDQFLRGGDSRILPPGSYGVIVSAPGYFPAHLTIELLPGVTTVVETSLLPETAGLLYVAARPWAELFVDGARVGYTGVSRHRLAPGRHTVRLMGRGRQTIDTTIAMRERGVVRISWGGRGERVGSSRLDSALTMLDEGETERGIALLRRFLDTEPSSSPALRASALYRLAEATWSLGERDSARTHLRDGITADPMHAPPADLFNPEIRSAYLTVRRTMEFVSLHAPPDTVLTPFRDQLPIRIAVGRPGTVRLFLRRGELGRRDSLLSAIMVDSVSSTAIALAGHDGSVLQPGTYAIEATLAGGDGRASDRLELIIGRVPVDTLPHPPPLPAASLQLETRRGSPTGRTIIESAGLAVAALFVLGIANDGELSGRSIPIAAVLVGAAAATTNVVHDRRRVPIPPAIARNDSLRTRWAEQERAIATENARRLRSSPLTITIRRSP